MIGQELYEAAIRAAQRINTDAFPVDLALRVRLIADGNVVEIEVEASDCGAADSDEKNPRMFHAGMSVSPTADESIIAREILGMIMVAVQRMMFDTITIDGRPAKRRDWT